MVIGASTAEDRKLFVESVQPAEFLQNLHFRHGIGKIEFTLEHEFLRYIGEKVFERNGTGPLQHPFQVFFSMRKIRTSHNLKVFTVFSVCLGIHEIVKLGRFRHLHLDYPCPVRLFIQQ